MPSGKLWGRSLTDAIAGCNRFQFVSKSQYINIRLIMMAAFTSLNHEVMDISHFI
ncbi:hypothetical protein A79E_1515 [Klebsiella pneumoniae subsp. pneumoniae 1084]|nr:hypothetical protein A79E_1515 [Klebsiella pneumoniae subsp. pneumoniae 1084]